MTFDCPDDPPYVEISTEEWERILYDENGFEIPIDGKLAFVQGQAARDAAEKLAKELGQNANGIGWACYTRRYGFLGEEYAHYGK